MAIISASRARIASIAGRPRGAFMEVLLLRSRQEWFGAEPYHSQRVKSLTLIKEAAFWKKAIADDRISLE